MKGIGTMKVSTRKKIEILAWIIGPVGALLLSGSSGFGTALVLSRELTRGSTLERVINVGLLGGLSLIILGIVLSLIVSIEPMKQDDELSME